MSRMLKKSPFSPSQPWRAETRLCPCVVLASFRSSTYRLKLSEIGSAGGVFPFAKVKCTGERPHKCGGYLLRSSLAAALLSGLFEHPAGHCFRGRLERLRRQERCEYFRRLRGDFGQKSLHFDVGEDDVGLPLKGFIVTPFETVSFLRRTDKASGFYQKVLYLNKR